MIGEYINIALMILILIATFLILKSPKNNKKTTDNKESEL